MKKRKCSLVQRMFAVLLAAVLTAGVVSNAVPASVLAQEGSSAASVGGNDVALTKETSKSEAGTGQETPEPEAGTEQETPKPEAGTEQETPEPEAGTEQETPEPEAGTEQETTGTETEEKTEQETVSGTPAVDEENGNLQALLARIAALPDAEEYLATEPDADSGEADEDAYEQWLAGLYAHAEEALAIQEAVEELSEEERAGIPEEALAKLAAWAEAAEQAAKSSMVMTMAEADDIGSGTDWVLDADGKLTIASDDGMSDWIKNRFNYDKQVKSVEIQDGVTSIGKYAFSNCSSLTDITIPADVTSIKASAFQYCSSLTNITIPAGVTSIGIYAFSGCRSLTGITIPSGVTSIETAAFQECSSLTNITIPEKVTSIGRYAFNRCSGLTNITIPAGVTSIGEYAFNDCNGLTSITIPEGVNSIEPYAFSGCSGLTSITIPEKVTSISSYAFSGCSGLTSITIPEKVTGISNSAFNGCSGLTEVNIKGETPPSLGGDVFRNCGFVTGNTQGIHVPKDKAQAYKTAWTDWAAYITDGTHTHSWSLDWTSNETHHWHECTVSDCPITDNANKDGYGAHIYDNDSDTDCNTCGYERTAAVTEITGIEVSCDLTSARAAQIGDELEKPSAFATFSPDVPKGSVYWWQRKEDSGFTKYEGSEWEEGVYVYEVKLAIYGDEGVIFAAELQITSSTGENWTVVERSDDNRTIVLRSDEIVKTARPHTHDLMLTPAKDATCTEDGNTAYYVCGGNDGCGKWFSDAEGTQEIKNHASVVILKTGHSYNESAWGYTGADGHAHKCRNCNEHDTVQAHTPGEAATETTPQTCTVCGYEISPAIGHTHNYGDWQHDSTQHWKVCPCGDETGRENHDFGDWVTDREATATEAGTKHRDCRTCSYTETGIIPATGESHTHNYGGWRHDNTQHWKVCSCGNEIGRANHDFGDWITDQEATATEAGTKHRDCRTCSYTETGTIPATGTEPGSGTVTPEVKPGANAPAANISTPAEELKDMLLTNDEKQQVQNGTNIRIVLEVQDAGNTVSVSDRAAVAVAQALNGYTEGQYLNIDLYKMVGENRTDITETAKKIRIVITVPDSLKNADSSKTRTFAVIRVHNGSAELLTDLDDSADTITIETDRFSTYAVVYKDTANSGSGGNGGGNNDGDNTGGSGNTGANTGGSGNSGDNTGGGGNSGANIGGSGNSGDDTGDSGNSGDNTGGGNSGDDTGDSGNTGDSGSSGDNGNNCNDNKNGNNNNSGNSGNQNNKVDKNDTKPVSSKDNEPKTGDAAPLELYATLSMIAGFAYLLLYFTGRKRGMTEETKKELVAGIVGWAKRGGRIRKYLALTAVFVLLVYYHSIGKKTCAEWKEVYGE